VLDLRWTTEDDKLTLRLGPQDHQYLWTDEENAASSPELHDLPYQASRREAEAGWSRSGACSDYRRTTRF
jgi:hypothetical protein